jgi:hypothetical protein
MNKSKAEYAICNRTDCVGIVWSTDLGRIVVMDKPIDINGDISIHACGGMGEAIVNVDLRNVIMEILPKEK